MQKIIKAIARISGIFVIIITLFIGLSYINHKFQLAREDKLFIPPGELIEVNASQMHLYTEGEGETSLVFMAGGGTSSPFLDFKSLYSLLSDKYRIIVVEKLGYGFSDIVDLDRDIGSILSDTRELISKAGIEGPFILMPHSMSGIEALYWAQEYPEEVKAIIGLDMAVPESYDEFDLNMPLVKLSALAAKLGITRWIPGLAESDAIKYGILTDKEKDLYKAIFYRRTATKTMIREVEGIKTNAKVVKDAGIPDIPMLIFSSNGEGTGWHKEVWRKFQEDYINMAKDAQIIKLDCSHYIHDIEYKIISKETDSFIRSLTK